MAKLTALLLIALVGAAAAAPGGSPCTGNYKAQGHVRNVDTIRLQSLNSAYAYIDEDVEHPTVVLYSDDPLDGLKSLNTKVEDGELWVGAADNDREKCLHILLPPNSDVETLTVDDNTTLTLTGVFSLPILKLSVINGYVYESNHSDFSLVIDSLLINNTGVGNVYMTHSDDSVTELEIVNNGNGDTWFSGTAGSVEVHHDGIGNIYLGKVTGNMEVMLTGQGDIAVEGSDSMKVSGAIKHPYQVLYEEGKCDLEAIMGNALFQPCKKVDAVADELTTIAG